MKYSSREIEDVFLKGEKNKIIEEYFGKKDFKALQKLGGKVTKGLQKTKANNRVYILPGIMGSTLWGDRKFFPDDMIWIYPINLTLGGIKKLKIGSEPNPIFAKDAIDLFYLKMKLSLKVSGYDVDYMPYDWRHSPNTVGKALLDTIKSRGERKVTLVCHSMGGLLARQMAALDPKRKYIQKVITIGTPNYGSYSVVEIFALTHSTLQILAKIDLTHSDIEIVDNYIKYFRGMLEMLPDNRIRPNENYFKLSNWPKAGLKPPKTALNKAKKAKRILPSVDDRFIQIVGMSKKTIQSAKIKNGKFQFKVNNDGDGTVPRDFAEMGNVNRYYVDGLHRKLLNITKTIKAVKDLIETGKTNKLRKSPMSSGKAISSMKKIDQNTLKKANGKKSKINIEKILKGRFDEQFMV